ncbi:nicotinate (nicotinamide) nucleotide adenylyltransferase [bacterium]|nr:nicotinate (nicotinamide) nucleotide adenylyltransferase [bacterium]MBU1993330.1 nicotinate (nicotinamide) nucleotide adenylyltransferase [bacterium]
METIALFGGSFDPPHIGHEAIVRALLNFNDVEKVVIMPTFLNPFKSKSYAPAKLRLKWLKEIFSDYENVEIDSYEIDLKKKVPSIQSVQHLLKNYKKIYLLIGADNVKTLDTWHKYAELKELVTFIVAPRDDIKIPSDFLKIDLNIDTSSTKLRECMDISKLQQKCAIEISNFYKENNAK